ncbi:hypothetical protein RYX36_028498, partial [Vicia faba]
EKSRAPMRQEGCGLMVAGAFRGGAVLCADRRPRSCSGRGFRFCDVADGGS